MKHLYAYLRYRMPSYIRNCSLFILFVIPVYLSGFINAQAAIPQFSDPAAFELGGQAPQDLEIQDLNYDGHQDMVSVTSTKINFLLGDGTGRLLKDNSITMNDVNDVEFADFNNDGLLDMAIARGGLSLSAVNGVDIYLGTGGEAPQFVFKRFLQTLRDSGPIVLGDFNEDGNVDVLSQGVVANQQLSAGIFFGLGDGTFSKPVSIDRSWNYLADLETVDINNDGHLDLIGGGIALGTGTGEFTGTGNGFKESAVGDLNNDGLLDVVGSIESSFGPMGIQVALQQTDGSFLYLLTSNPDYIAEIGIADFNRDGKGDILIRFVDGDLVAYEANDDGSLNAGTNINTIPYQGRLWSQHFMLSDFNEDGFIDIASPDWLLTNDSSIWIQLQIPDLVNDPFVDTEAPNVSIISAQNGDVL
ncbi:MAG: VCBS repeat-containing protein, partial [Gammaproteobacteria bacterium]|nr:VCBS repeat-containing protein [Gammaproteobacteria bacterium]